jgi:hypothetical protein
LPIIQNLLKFSIYLPINHCTKNLRLGKEQQEEKKMAANIKSVHLVIGPRTRVVSVQVNGGRVNRKIIRKLMKNGEQLLGVIGHHRGTLSPEGALKILEARVEALDVSRSRSADLKLDLLFDPNSNMVAMRGEVTIGQMRQFVKETRYVATGYNADEFKRLI